MRIIAGRLGGRSFESPHSHRTHPMADKVRGALFNALGDIEGLTVLDGFAGTGALAFEALSRGAASALLLENDRPAQRSISANIAALNLGSRARLIMANCSGWSERNPDERFDLVLADPPFDNLQVTALTKLTAHVRQPDGLFVLNWPGKHAPPSFESFTIVDQKTYGDTQLVFYRAAAA